MSIFSQVAEFFRDGHWTRNELYLDEDGEETVLKERVHTACALGAIYMLDGMDLVAGMSYPSTVTTEFLGNYLMTHPEAWPEHMRSMYFDGAGFKFPHSEMTKTQVVFHWNDGHSDDEIQNIIDVFKRVEDEWNLAQEES